MKESFNPNDLAAANGNIFGFPYTEEAADIILLPVPWEVTTSYGTGTVYGPQRILEESTQLDFVDPLNVEGWKTKVFMPEIDRELLEQSHLMRQLFDVYEAALEARKVPDEQDKQKLNDACKQMVQSVQHQAKKYLDAGKKVGVIGGDHSTPLGLMRALSEKTDFGILQIDAHADLREAYMDMEHSHASIMYNALKQERITSLVQVGIRDLCPAEKQSIETDGRISCFYDWDLSAKKLSGIPFRSTADKIIDSLPQRVYISFDVDGMDPSLCPNTGTPVPGGLQWGEVNMLFQLLQQSGKEIVGFDLCETGNGRADGSVSARLLFKMIQLL